MKYIKAIVGGQDLYLQQNGDGTWSVMSEAPSYPGVYPVTIEIQADSGVVILIGEDDPALGDFLRLFVNGEPRTRLADYAPPFIRDIPEFMALLNTAALEKDRLQDRIQVIISDAFILTATESRIIEWEKDLSIVPAGNLAQRKSYILACLRGQGKLNETRIKQVVNAFTGGDALVSFENSTVVVKILAPALGDVYLYPDVERALLPRVPAHIGLSVQRFYSTWADVKENYTDWAAVANLDNWNALKNYIP